jgi:hypothetical protein
MLPRSTGTSTYKPLPTDANLVDHDQDHDWLRNADDVDIERQAGLPTYPPPPAQPTGTNETTHPPGLTTWTYNPVWPMRGEKQRALGPIASSRQVSRSARPLYILHTERASLTNKHRNYRRRQSNSLAEPSPRYVTFQIKRSPSRSLRTRTWNLSGRTSSSSTMRGKRWPQVQRDRCWFPSGKHMRRPRSVSLIWTD